MQVHLFPTIRLALAALLALVTAGAQGYDYEADFDPADRATWPVIAIIIDDIGHRGVEGNRAVALPGPVACAVLPHTPHGARLARSAHASGKEVMLHLPLEAMASNELLGPGAITLDVSQRQFQRVLLDNLAAVPHVTGVNNHMGSLLTRHPGHMTWLMRELRGAGELFFVDSITTEASVAYQVARENGVPALRRDVFLDSRPGSDAVAHAFERLKQAARRNGHAVGIGHPLPATMDFLERALPRLDKTGYRLVRLRDLIALETQVTPVIQAGGVAATGGDIVKGEP